ncbi:MAG: hypothetical protein C0469_17295 [Cyanobacteria bacterium DS2.3.42]|nr:hypothetical protein [Cyanobacteria bacterium DS2.3.42]
MFDSVKLKTNLDCDDIYGGEIQLRKGKQGCVLEMGQEPNTVIVEFKIGRGMKGSTDFSAVEIDADSLEMVSKIGRRFSEHEPIFRDSQGHQGWQTQVKEQRSF